MHHTTPQIALLINRLLSLCLIGLIVLAILPWLIPTTHFGGFMLSMFGVSGYLPAPHQAFGDGWYAFSWHTRLLGMLASSLCLLPTWMATRLIINLCKSQVLNQVFVPISAKVFTRLGLLYLASALLLQPLAQAIFSYAVTTNNPHQAHYIGINLDLSNISTIFFSLLLIVIGQIMKMAYRAVEEQQLTI